MSTVMHHGWEQDTVAAQLSAPAAEAGPREPPEITSNLRFRGLRALITPTTRLATRLQFRGPWVHRCTRSLRCRMAKTCSNMISMTCTLPKKMHRWNQAATLNHPTKSSRVSPFLKEIWAEPCRRAWLAGVAWVLMTTQATGNSRYASVPSAPIRAYPRSLRANSRLAPRR